jgi:hypothetical protein
MIIRVSQRDIDTGHVASCQDCPIAIATKRRVKGLVLVHGSNMTINSEHEIELPIQAVAFVLNFDKQGKNSVQPFFFEIDIPIHLRKPGWSVEDS